jgi:hypothetical protein
MKKSITKRRKSRSSIENFRVLILYQKKMGKGKTLLQLFASRFSKCQTFLLTASAAHLFEVMKKATFTFKTCFFFFQKHGFPGWFIVDDLIKTKQHTQNGCWFLVVFEGKVNCCISMGHKKERHAPVRGCFLVPTWLIGDSPPA